MLHYIGGCGMAEGKELKPRSFRINDETMEKFKVIAASLGGNQQEVMAKLIEVFELQSSKSAMPDKSAEIEQFERYITAISRMYMANLEDNQNITKTVQAEFDALLRSKDTTIQDLQEQLTVAKQLKEESLKRAKTYEEENVRLTNNIDKINKEYDAKLSNLQAMLDDKDKLNKALTDTCTDLKSKIGEMAADVEHVAEVQTQCNHLRQTQAETSKELEDLKKQLQQVQTAHNEALERQKEMAQIALDKALIEMDRKYQEQIQGLKAEKQAEIDKYQQKYFELLEKKSQ